MKLMEHIIDPEEAANQIHTVLEANDSVGSIDEFQSATEDHLTDLQKIYVDLDGIAEHDDEYPKDVREGLRDVQGDLYDVKQWIEEYHEALEEIDGVNAD